MPYLQQFALHYREDYQDEPTTPLFRFGYGLSFSNFTTSAPRVASGTKPISAVDTIEVEVDVTNNSPTTAGATVVQLYYQQKGAAVIRYYQQLVRYERVHVAAGATVTVTLPLKIADLAYWDDKEAGYLPGRRGWALGRPGRTAQYVLMAGLSAAECTGSYGTSAKPSGCDLPSTTISFEVAAEEEAAAATAAAV